MSKLETIASAKADLIAGQDSLLEGSLGKCYDVGFQDGGDGIKPGFTQADIDHAVGIAVEAAKVEADAALSNALSNAKVVSDQALVDLQVKCDVDKSEALVAQKAIDDALLADEHAKGEAALVEVKIALEEMTVKAQVSEQAVQGFKENVDKLQASLDAIKALLFPV